MNIKYAWYVDEHVMLLNGLAKKKKQNNINYLNHYYFGSQCYRVFEQKFSLYQEGSRYTEKI